MRRRWPKRHRRYISTAAVAAFVLAGCATTTADPIATHRNDLDACAQGNGTTQRCDVSAAAVLADMLDQRDSRQARSGQIKLYSTTLTEHLNSDHRCRAAVSDGRCRYDYLDLKVMSDAYFQ